MGQPLITALLYTVVIAAITAKPIERRQTPAPLIDEYITQVRTALYVISSLQTFNYSDSCNDLDLPARLDSYGYDGEYAEQLLCEAAVGIQIFTDLDRAETDATNALEALESLKGSQAGVGGPQWASSCGSVGVRTLNEAGLDGFGIRDAICSAAVETTTLTIESTATESTSASFSGLPLTATISVPTHAMGSPSPGVEPTSAEASMSAAVSATFSNTAAPRAPGNITTSASSNEPSTSNITSASTASQVIIIAPGPPQSSVRGATYTHGPSFPGTAVYTIPTEISSKSPSLGFSSNTSSTIPLTGSLLTPYLPYASSASANTSTALTPTGTDPNTSSFVYIPDATNSTGTYTPIATTTSTSSTTFHYVPNPYASTTTIDTNTTTTSSLSSHFNFTSGTIYTTPSPSSTTSSSSLVQSLTEPVQTSNATGPCCTGTLPPRTANTSSTALPPYFNTSSFVYGPAQTGTSASVPLSTAIWPTTVETACCGLDPATSNSTATTNMTMPTLPPYLNLTTTTTSTTLWVTGTSYLVATLDPYPTFSDDDGTTITIDITTTTTVFITTTVTPTWNGTATYPTGSTGRVPWSWTGDWLSSSGAHGRPTGVTGSSLSTHQLSSTGATRPTGHGSSGSPVTGSSTASWSATGSTTGHPPYGPGPYRPIWTGRPSWVKDCSEGW